MAGPLTPQEVRECAIPDIVFEVFNDLIVRNFDGCISRVYLKDVKEALQESFPNYKNHHLNVEHHYRKVGWNVSFFKKEVGDRFDSHFIFSEK